MTTMTEPKDKPLKIEWLRKIPSFRLFFPRDSLDDFYGYVREIMMSGRLTLGPFTERFERAWANYIGVNHAIAVSSGTSALYIIYRYLKYVGIESISVPTNTFSASASAALDAGLKVVLRDTDETGSPHAHLVVHIGGYPQRCQWPLESLVIEDASHAHGSVLGSHLCGNLGYASAFSFYPTKVMTTGEGGMICTNSFDLASYARCLRDQGKESFNSNNIVERGLNARMTEISAAMGICQLKTLPKALEERRRVAKIYDGILGDMAYKTFGVPNYYKYIVVLNPAFDGMSALGSYWENLKYRGIIKAKLKEKGISCSGEVYWPPLHLQPAYRSLVTMESPSFAKAEGFCSRHLCLPIYPDMEVGDVEYVAKTFLEVVK